MLLFRLIRSEKEELIIFLTQKTRYGLRAVFELAKRKGTRPTAVSELARAQSIPQRFLEAILSQLKKAGIVESRRGNEGGYVLVLAPERLTVLDVVEALQGPISTKSDSGHRIEGAVPLDMVLTPIWDDACAAVNKVYASKTFAYLLKKEAAGQSFVPDFQI